MLAYRIVTMTALTLLFAAAHAQPTTQPNARQPLTQGISSVDKNLQKNPDNKGLQTASEKLEANRKRQEEQQAKTAARVEEARAQREERSARRDAIDRPERPARGGR